jgi:hypothetical protein
VETVENLREQEGNISEVVQKYFDGTHLQIGFFFLGLVLGCIDASNNDSRLIFLCFSISIYSIQWSNRLSMESAYFSIICLTIFQMFSEICKELSFNFSFFTRIRLEGSGAIL